MDTHVSSREPGTRERNPGIGEPSSEYWERLLVRGHLLLASLVAAVGLTGSAPAAPAGPGPLGAGVSAAPAVTGAPAAPAESVAPGPQAGGVAAAPAAPAAGDPAAKAPEPQAAPAGESLVLMPLGAGSSNDACEGAVGIPDCGYPDPGPLRPAFPYLTTTVNVTGATTEGDPSPSCKRKVGSGIWYQFTPHQKGKYKFTTCYLSAPGTTVEDTALAVFRSSAGVCPEKAEIACGDDDSSCTGGEKQSSLTIDLDPYKTYFVLAYAAQNSPPGSIQVSVEPAPKKVLQNGDFELGEFGDTWFADGDTTIVATDPPPPCFTTGNVNLGCYMACMSTSNFFGGEAEGDVRSDLTSYEVSFQSRPTQIKVSFNVSFQTEENPVTLGTNDSFEAKLITTSGTFPILVLDTFGRTPPGKGLKVRNFTGLTPSPPGCTLTNGLTMGWLKVSWTRSLDAVLQNEIQRGPVWVEFSILRQGSPERTSIACVDNVKISGSN